jgi:CTP synthase
VQLATSDHKPEVKVALVAKYMDNTDTYMSVFEALKSAAWHNGARVQIDWIDASHYDVDG